MTGRPVTSGLAIIGPGLVGCWLGAAAGATRAVPGPSRQVRARRVALPAGEVLWEPALSDIASLPANANVLACTRADRTPWERLPGAALAAQNGLGQPRPVVTCFLALDVDDGVLRCRTVPRLVLADPGPAWAGVIEAWRDAGLTVEVVDDPRPAQWEKAILNATIGPLCRSTGLGLGAVWADPHWRRLALDATAEGVRIAAAAGVALQPGTVERAAAFFDAAGDHIPSVVHDPGELPWVLDPLLATATRHRIGASALERIAAMSRPMAVPLLPPATPPLLLDELLTRNDEDDAPLAADDEAAADNDDDLLVVDDL